MKKEIRLRDLINVDYTDGDTPEDDQGMIPYQYIKRHRGQIGEDSLQTMHTNAWHEIIDNASPQVSETLMNISCNKQPGLLSGADKIKIDEILQQTSDVNLQKAIRTFMGTIENVVYDKEVNEFGIKDWLKLVQDNNPDKLEASAGRLMPILVKAIQDLSEQIKDLQSKINNN